MKYQLGDIAEFINGDRGKNYPSQEEISEKGDVPFVNAGLLENDSIDFTNMNYISNEKYEMLNSGKFKENDILYCLRGSLGKKALVKKNEYGAIASSLVIIRPNEKIATGRYLLKALESPGIMKQQAMANNGSSQPNLSASSVKNYYVTIPSLPEQIAVTNTLERVSHLFTLRHQQLEKLDLLVKSRFVEMFGNPLDPVIVNKYFVECVEFNPKKSEVKDLMDEYASFVPMECVGVDGTFTIKENGLVKNYYKGYTYFRDGDVLLAKITPCFENGKVAIADNCINGIGFGTTEFHVSRPIKGISNPQWIKHLLKNDFVHDYAAINMTGSAGQKRIQTPFFEKLKIYLPPIDLQNQFADFVQQVDKSKFAIKKSLEKLELLKKKLMQDYFG